MRTHHLSTHSSLVTRGAGASVIASAAYITRSAITEMKNGQEVARWDYSKQGQGQVSSALQAHSDYATRSGSFTARDDLGFTEILAPVGAPEWVYDRQTLWARVEADEDQWADKHYRRRPELAQKHKESAHLAYKGHISLARELDINGQIEVARQVLKEHFVDRGMVVEWALHLKEGQPHLHFQAAARTFKNGGFLGKYASYSTPEMRREEAIVHLPARALGSFQKELRQRAAAIQNAKLAERGVDSVHVEHRSFVALGIEFAPQVSNGPGKPNEERLAENEERRLGNAELVLADPNVVIREAFSNTATLTEGQLRAAIQRRTLDDEHFALVWERIHSDGIVVCLGEDTRGLQTYTSAEYQQAEVALQASARQLAERNKGLGDEERAALESAIAAFQKEKGFSLKAEQREALEHIASAGDLSVIVGLPGAGKTTLLEAARTYFTSLGHNVRGAATAAIAAENLEAEAGIASQTVQKIILSYEAAAKIRSELKDPKMTERHRASMKRRLARFEASHFKAGDVLIVDEAGMVGTREVEILQRHAVAAGAKIIHVGDPEQLSSVSAGHALRLLKDEHGASFLREITRQKEPDLKASYAMVEGRVGEAIAHYEGKGQLHFCETKGETISRLVDHYVSERLAADADGLPKWQRGMLITANRNADVEAINISIRARLREAGLLGAEAELFGRRYAIGDEVVFLKNDASIGIVVGETGAAGVKNGQRGTVRGLVFNTVGAVVGAQIEDARTGRILEFSGADGVELALGYAVTVHKSQGQTVDWHAHYAGNENRALSLVWLTRHRHELQIYADYETFRDDRRALVGQMSVESRQGLADDYSVSTEREPYREVIFRYREVCATYAAQMADIGMWADQYEESISEHPKWAATQELKAERNRLAVEISEDWEAYRVFAQQAGVTRHFIDEQAGKTERVLTHRQQRARERIEAYAALHIQAHAMLKEIKSTHSTRQAEHPDWGTYTELRQKRDALAAEIAEDRTSHASFAREAGIAWTSIQKQGRAHREQAKAEGQMADRPVQQASSDLEASTVMEFNKLSRQIDRLKRDGDKEKALEARNKARALAAEIFAAGAEAEEGLTPKSGLKYRNYTAGLRGVARLQGRARGASEAGQGAILPVTIEPTTGNERQPSAQVVTPEDLLRDRASEQLAGRAIAPEEFDAWSRSRVESIRAEFLHESQAERERRALDWMEIHAEDEWRAYISPVREQARGYVDQAAASMPTPADDFEERTEALIRASENLFQKEAVTTARAIAVPELLLQSRQERETAAKSAREEALRQVMAEQETSAEATISGGAALRKRSQAAMSTWPRGPRNQAAGLVLSNDQWVRELQEERNGRLRAHPRVEMSDLSEGERKAHAAAAQHCRLDAGEIKRLVNRARYREAFLDAIFGGASNGRVDKARLSWDNIKSRVLAEEMRRYEKSLQRMDLEENRRALLVEREFYQRAADLGIDVQTAKLGLSREQRRILKTLIRREVKTARLATSITTKRDRFRARNGSLEGDRDFLAEVSPHEATAHVKAIDQMRWQPVDVQQLLADRERSLAMEQATKARVPLFSSYKSLKIDEARVAVHKAEMRLYERALAEQGLAREQATRLIQLEAAARATELGIIDQKEAVRISEEMKSHALADRRLETVTDLIDQGRSRGARVALVAEPDAIREAHERAAQFATLSRSEMVVGLRPIEAQEAYQAATEAARKVGRTYLETRREVNESKFSHREVAKFVFNEEMAKYERALQIGGLSEADRVRLVEQERLQRGFELGLISRAERDNGAAKAGVSLEPENWQRQNMRLGAIAEVIIRERSDSLNPSTRLSKAEIVALARNIEWDLTEARAGEFGIGLEAAKAQTAISLELAWSAVEKVEAARADERQRTLADESEQPAIVEHGLQVASSVGRSNDGVKTRDLQEAVEQFRANVQTGEAARASGDREAIRKAEVAEKAAKVEIDRHERRTHEQKRATRHHRMHEAKRSAEEAFAKGDLAGFKKAANQAKTLEKEAETTRNITRDLVSDRRAEERLDELSRKEQQLASDRAAQR